MDAVPWRSSLFTSKQLNNLKRTPSRIYLGFIETDALRGHKHKNPYDFRRHWLVPASSSSNVTGTQPNTAPTPMDFCSPQIPPLPPNNPNYADDDDENESFDVIPEEAELPADVKKMTKNKLLQYLSSVLRGKSTQSRSRSDSRASSVSGDHSQQPGYSGNIPVNRRDVTQGGRAAAGGETPVDPPIVVKEAVDPDLLSPTKHYCFVKRVNLELNGMNFTGMIDSPPGSSKFDCAADFLRFQETQKTFRTNGTDGISYDMFNSNNFFAAWDLSTSLYRHEKVIPSTPEANQIRVTADFSEALPVDITMVFCCLYTNAFQIDHKGKVTLSYTNLA